MKKQTLMVAVSLSCLFSSGCVAGRRTVTLPVPQLASLGEGRGSINLGTVEDRRVFENQPKDAATPSIKGDVNRSSKEQLGTMIGRQRNTYGRALGDIALPTDDSVVKRTRLLLEAAFNRRGYQITQDPAAPNVATAAIKQFWAWFTPGMWSVSFEAHVVCTITITRADATIDVTVGGYGRNQGQVASNANWQLAYQRAFEDFLAKLDGELVKAGF